MTNTAIIHWLQSFHSPLLDLFFKAVTALGGEAFYMIAIPVIYWCVDKQFGFNLGAVFLFSSWTNIGLKDLFRIPRPSPDVVRVIERAGGYSFPSGHAQGTATFWTYLAKKVRRRWFSVVAAAVIVLVALSRPYLGVHYPTDVLAGAVLGAGIAILAHALGGERRELPVWAFVVVPVVFVLVDRTADSAKIAGFLAGLGSGRALDRRRLDFRVEGVLREQIVKVVVGLVALLGLRIGIKLLLPAGGWYDFIRYNVLGLAGGYGLPWLFVALGLARRGERFA